MILNSDGEYLFEASELSVLNTFVQCLERVSKQWDVDKTRTRFNGFPIQDTNFEPATRAPWEHESDRFYRSDRSDDDSDIEWEEKEDAKWVAYNKRSWQDKQCDGIEHVESECPEMRRFFTQDLLNFIHKFLQDTFDVTLVDACRDMPSYPGVYMCGPNYFRRQRHFRIFDTVAHFQVIVRIQRSPKPHVSEVSVVQIEYSA